MKKFIISICVVCMILSQSVVAFAATEWAGGEREPNNSMVDAEEIEISNEYYEWYFIYGIVNQNDKEDWFVLTSDWSGRSDIELYIADANVDINCNLCLYDQNGNCLATVSVVDRFAEIDYIYISKGRQYYIKVEHESGTEWAEPYELFISVNK